jgi:hypothetical protein
MKSGSQHGQTVGPRALPHAGSSEPGIWIPEDLVKNPVPGADRCISNNRFAIRNRAKHLHHKHLDFSNRLKTGLLVHPFRQPCAIDARPLSIQHTQTLPGAIENV